MQQGPLTWLNPERIEPLGTIQAERYRDKQQAVQEFNLSDMTKTYTPIVRNHPRDYERTEN